MFNYEVSITINDVQTIKLSANYNHHHFAPRMFFLLFLKPANVPRLQGSAGCCSLVVIFRDLEHPTFANLWQSCHIPALLSISFLVFFVSSTFNCSAFTNLSLHPFSPHAPAVTTFALSKTFPLSPH